MNKLLFIVVLLVLFTLELSQPVSKWFIMPFTQGLASVSAWIVQLFDSSVASEGIVIRSLSNGSAVAIQPGCNGIEAMICITAAMVAYSASWYEKTMGLLVGFLAIQALNLIRIISLFYLLQWNQQWFEWFHLYVWQALIFLDVLIVFILWIRWLPSRKGDGKPTIKNTEASNG